MKKLITTIIVTIFAIAISVPTFAQPGGDSIVDIAEDNGFTILSTLVSSLGYEDALDDNRPFTVFAPTDEAFTNLITFLVDEGYYASVADVLADTDTLNTILTYHVVPGRWYSTSVLNANRFRTLGGEFLSGDIVVDASPIALDIKASNGVIHIIDEVLLPPSVLAALGL